MFNKDYIMRMIELLVQGIAKIMRLRQENRFEECEAALQDTLHTFYGLNVESLARLPWTDLVAVASLGGVPDAEKCTLLAQLMREKAELEEANGRGDAASALLNKALCIYISALLADSDFNTQAHRDNVDAMAASAGKYEPPADALGLLFQYYELTGRYAKAEDALYRLLELPECREEHIGQGRAFYRRLLEKADAELEAGNLPRNEVLDGLRNLK